MWELINTEKRDGFVIRFYATPEDVHPNDSFDDEGQTARDIDAGLYEWFTAKVTASMAGIDLGTDYLGCCCYPNVTDFMGELYYEDMVAAAIHQAREHLAALTEMQGRLAHA